ncbi:hypothetical protein M409DRAFT_59609 [Zasmidium cellare ATCC 36951]|uniref:Uncharacterized protein n=1 Tax=Zasmidium cellare ATCC 36951 TaxID=1080233 RepID=A0A6A6C1J5_ZASCE|nr:uncharacterized protein M409DRAFT_59609 [Zasmidium cellare ATCC 36951]KAF2160815.1 hypothetical protein M409DRAFT_59609 [Zasmidium cellare ATCC 36951]
MHLSTLLLGFFLSASAAPTANLGTPYPPLTPCTKDTRLKIAQTIIGAFNDPNDLNSIATLENAPFKPDGTIEFCINGAPCLRLGLNGAISKDVAAAARQAVARVDTIFTAYDNGTTVMDAEVTFGVGALGVPLPIKTAIYVPGVIDTQDCRIIDPPAYFTLPNEVAGFPVTPPTLPGLGLGTIPDVTVPS